MKTLVKMRVLVVLMLALVRSTLQDTCDPAKCVLPDCRCFGQDIPGGLAVRDFTISHMQTPKLRESRKPKQPRFIVN